MTQEIFAGDKLAIAFYTRTRDARRDTAEILENMGTNILLCGLELGVQSWSSCY